MATEVADQVGAFEVCRKPLQRPVFLATETGHRFHDMALTDVTFVLKSSHALRLPSYVQESTLELGRINLEKIIKTIN